MVRKHKCRCPVPKCEPRRWFSACLHAVSMDWDAQPKRAAAAGVVQTTWRVVGLLFICASLVGQWHYHCSPQDNTSPAPSLSQCFFKTLLKFTKWSQFLVVAHLLLGIFRSVGSNGCRLEMGCRERFREDCWCPRIRVLTTRGREAEESGKIEEVWTRSAKASYVLFQLAFCASLVATVGFYAMMYPAQLQAKALDTSMIGTFYMVSAHGVPFGVMFMDLVVGYNRMAAAHVLLPSAVAAVYVLANYLYVHYSGGDPIYATVKWDGGASTAYFSIGLVVGSLVAFIAGGAMAWFRDAACGRRGGNLDYQPWTPKGDWL